MNNSIDNQTIETIWANFNNQKAEIVESEFSKVAGTGCQCGCKKMCYTQNEVICSHCGLVQEMFLNESNYGYEHQMETPIKKASVGNTRLQKMQDWYMWTNDEKNTYKLVCYTRDMCSQLGIPENIIGSVCETVVNVMDTIKRNDGTKRARVKDGIILVCIQYVYKDLVKNVSAAELAKKINLDIKYITKAEKLILELINRNKLDIERSSVLKLKTPFQYVTDVISKHNMKISAHILNATEKLIDICKQNDLLLDHTPLSVGVCCFYYILRANDIDCDIKVLCEFYNLSAVTVIKTYNKLKMSNNILEKYFYPV